MKIKKNKFELTNKEAVFIRDVLGGISESTLCTIRQASYWNNEMNLEKADYFLGELWAKLNKFTIKN